MSRSLLVAFAVLELVTSSRPRSQHQQVGALRNAVGYYDSKLGRVVMVGSAGATNGQPNHAWSWTGTNWTVLTDQGPPSRANASITYDLLRKAAVASGGMETLSETSAIVVGETWEDAGDGWRRVAGGQHSPRDHHALVFDDARGHVLMYGGIPGAGVAQSRRDYSGPWPTDTWALRDGRWHVIATDGPAGRGRTALAYDGKRNEAVLFGGVGAAPGPGQPQPFLGDTWVWNGAIWRQAAASGPPARYAHAMVFDERRGVVLLYGGRSSHRGGALTDMWQWDGTRWTEITLTGATPGSRYQPVMVYDKARGVTVLHGGDSQTGSPTWEWDGTEWKAVPFPR